VKVWALIAQCFKVLPTPTQFNFLSSSPPFPRGMGVFFCASDLRINSPTPHPRSICADDAADVSRGRWETSAASTLHTNFHAPVLGAQRIMKVLGFGQHSVASPRRWVTRAHAAPSCGGKTHLPAPPHTFTRRQLLDAAEFHRNGCSKCFRGSQ